MLEKKDRIELRSIAQTMKATIQIGKGGVTDGIVKEINAQLKRHKVVKVKLLRSAFSDELEDREALARAITERTGADLVEIKGNTIVLAITGRKNKVSSTQGKKNKHAKRTSEEE